MELVLLRAQFWARGDRVAASQLPPLGTTSPDRRGPDLGCVYAAGLF